ncbi:hypothetical protein BGY98DRAFT_471813 [Russula aff. rugulosa BPL654]|nr:hypothetical protein BGY98DRAFT_471813 [Russula aff. rugulosa BPL654]
MLLGLVRLLIWGSRLGIRDVSVVALVCCLIATSITSSRTLNSHLSCAIPTSFLLSLPLCYFLNRPLLMLLQFRLKVAWSGKGVVGLLAAEFQSRQTLALILRPNLRCKT